MVTLIKFLIALIISFFSDTIEEPKKTDHRNTEKVVLYQLKMKTDECCIYTCKTS